MALYFSQRLLVNWQNSKLYLSFDLAINTVLINERLLLKQEAWGNNCFRYFRDFWKFLLECLSQQQYRMQYHFTTKSFLLTLIPVRSFDSAFIMLCIFRWIFSKIGYWKICLQACQKIIIYLNPISASIALIWK